ncbi:MAG TPA: hypothetical protein VNX68_19810, partial [Nitrosopumilaceae archaeon]|nr:hypothetical protein [Nitrosopumilaceae archaeon]
ILKELFGYKSLEYTLLLNNESFLREAFLISFANAGQYGNDFYIAPEANMEDGLLHIVVLKPFPLFMIPSLISKIFRRRINKSSYIETYTAKELKIIRAKTGSVHFDGEPFSMDQEINISIVPKSLKVIC